MTNGKTTVEIVVSIGSNCGDKRRNVAEGIEWLRTHLGMKRFSSIYATPDCHGGQRQYMNAVGIGETVFSLSQLEVMCKRHELECGRTPEARSAGDVPLDIDVVVYEGNIIRDTDFRQVFFKIGYEELK